MCAVYVGQCFDKTNAQRVFRHRMNCAEVFLALTDQLNQLEGLDEGLTVNLGGFAENAAAW